MGFPLPPNVPVLMIALQPLSETSWAEQLPGIVAGASFWASSADAPRLAADGMAEYAPAGTPAPPAEPAWTAHGIPGFGAGASNCTH